jgi:hypothetical protein
MGVPVDPGLLGIFGDIGVLGVRGLEISSCSLPHEWFHDQLWMVWHCIEVDVYVVYLLMMVETR